MRQPLQTLVGPATAAAWLGQGSALLAGPAVRLSDAAAWTTPALVLGAYGVDGAEAASVDVLRFLPTEVTAVEVPGPGDATTAAGYGRGFLPGGLVPVWDIAPTTVPRGSELWRIHADGTQEMLAPYAGPASGWLGTGVFAPTPAVLGPRARWNGVEYAVSWVDDETVELVAVGEQPEEGFAQTRPHIFARTVARAECEEIFALTVHARWRDIACVAVDSDGAEVAVLLRTDAETAQRVGALTLEPGVFWLPVPRAELSDIRSEATLPVSSSL